MIHISDNCVKGKEVAEEHICNLQKIAEKPISELNLDDYPNLLIFPSCFDECGDMIGKEHILEVKERMLFTSNVMGFIGYQNTKIRIHSRFAQQDGNDYFLHYMLQRVFAVNLFDLKYNADEESLFDFLIYLFPAFLKRAICQGVYKEYQTRQYNNSNVKGRVEVGRHIQQNIPFIGKAAFSVRENAYDNHVNQLIRHTIEYIAQLSYCGSILQNDDSIKDAVAKIRGITPTYNQKERRIVVSQNLRPLNHPYYYEYRNLQRLCMQILRHEELKYGYDDQEIYGVLFDGAWRWEEYLNTFFKDEGFKHPQNNKGAGGLRMFRDNIGYETVMPDFYKQNVVLDAKYKGYKEWSDVGREDRFQLLAYMYLLHADYSGFVVPISNPFSIQTVRNFNGYGGTMALLGMNVAYLCTSFNEYVSCMTKEEKLLVEQIKQLNE